MNGISKERKEKENVDSVWYTGVRNEFRVRSLNHPHFSSEILVYLRGNKPCSDHLLFNRRAGFRSDGKKSRDAGKAGRRRRGRSEKKRENVIRSRNKIKRIYTLVRGGFGAGGGGLDRATRARATPCRKRTNNLSTLPPHLAGDFTIDIYERSGVPKWKFTRPIIRSITSLFVRKLIDTRNQEFNPSSRHPLLSSYYNQICRIRLTLIQGVKWSWKKGMRLDKK